MPVEQNDNVVPKLRGFMKGLHAKGRVASTGNVKRVGLGTEGEEEDIRRVLPAVLESHRPCLWVNPIHRSLDKVHPRAFENVPKRYARSLAENSPNAFPLPRDKRGCDLVEHRRVHVIRVPVDERDQEPEAATTIVPRENARCPDTREPPADNEDISWCWCHRRHSTILSS